MQHVEIAKFLSRSKSFHVKLLDLQESLEVIVSVQPDMHEKTRFVNGLLVIIVLYRIQSEHFVAPLECIFATSLLSLFQTDAG